MNKKETFDKFLQNFHLFYAKYPALYFLYRGQSRAYAGAEQKQERITSSLHRDSPARTSLEQIEERIVNRARAMLYLPHSSNLEVLTDIQHHHGKTNCIDFTRSLLVALFFACYKDFDEKGEVFCLDIRKLKPLKEIDYPHDSKWQERGLNEVAMIEPAPSQISMMRIASQSSVFVRPGRGFIPADFYEVITIPSSEKRHILMSLRETFNISRISLFRDLPGFVDNERVFEESDRAFEQAKEKFSKEGDVKAFHDALDDILLSNPDYAPAYYRRGELDFNHSNFDAAIVNFSEAIKLNHRVEDCWRWRCSAYMFKEDAERALVDMNHISDSNKTELDYFQSSSIKTMLGKYKDALLDIQAAIRRGKKDEYLALEALIKGKIKQ